MTPKQFFDKVVELRQAQREYFRTRLPDALRKSKAIEAEIDKEIKRVQQIEAERAKAAADRLQGSLFPDS
ncbi:hypothetical protein NF347_11590 [Paramuribaculum intestinale]|uniref:hypothetical protein n=1 Tax=Paramuribaculum intestinale TaxID=2094151 RepID=UPI0027425B79|nr:hypothetical protein [Paramuribaculum intestinale]WLT41594.1 hypothetical protein NF347_11590 [Paramuribaculum intestinale]